MIQMLLQCVQELYIYFSSTIILQTGVKDKKRFIPIHDVAESGGSEVSGTLHILHAAIGCDSTTAFASHGKSIALKALSLSIIR